MCRAHGNILNAWKAQLRHQRLQLICWGRGGTRAAGHRCRRRARAVPAGPVISGSTAVRQHALHHINKTPLTLLTYLILTFEICLSTTRSLPALLARDFRLPGRILFSPSLVRGRADYRYRYVNFRIYPLQNCLMLRRWVHVVCAARPLQALKHPAQAPELSPSAQLQ